MWRVFGVGLDRALLRLVVSAALCLVLTFVAEGQEHPAISHTVRLKRGEALVLVLLTPLDSGRTQVGDDVSLKLLLPLTVEGVNVLPDGWPVHGRVSGVTRAGTNCTAGKVVWKPNEITSPDGAKIAISLGRAEKKAGKRVKETVKYTALAPLALPTLPYLVILWGGMHDEGGCRGAVGADEKLTAGTALSAEVSKDIVLALNP
jgi:hypothetical protein